MSSAGFVWYVRLCHSHEISLLLHEHGRYGSMEDCGVSNAEYLVYVVCMPE